MEQAFLFKPPSESSFLLDSKLIFQTYIKQATADASVGIFSCVTDVGV